MGEPSEIVQRYEFNSRVRQSGESISTFVSQLRSLAEHCNFGALLQVMLRDRLVCGISNPHMQQQLLANKDLTFDSAFALTLTSEAAARNVRPLQGTVAAVTDTKGGHQSEQSQRSSRGAPRQNCSCFRCGQSGHVASKNWFRGHSCKRREITWCKPRLFYSRAMFSFNLTVNPATSPCLALSCTQSLSPKDIAGIDSAR